MLNQQKFSLNSSDTIHSYANCKPVQLDLIFSGLDDPALYSMDDSVLYWLRESASGSGFALGPGLQWNDPTTRMVQCTMCLARLNGTIYNARPAQPWVDPHTSARGFTPKTLSTRCNHYIGEVISWSRPRGGRSDATGNAPSWY